MKKLAYLLSIGFLLTFNLAKAQNEIDALRYSRTTFGGTARSNAMAGAFGALGADFSSLANNPAGVGIYRRNEITFTPSLFWSNSETSYKGTSALDQKLNFNFGNAGIVVAYPVTKETSKWKSLNFGFGYNRTNNFNEQIAITGNNSTSSLVDQFLLNAQGTTPENLNGFAEGLAFNTYLIDTIPGETTQYLTYFPTDSLKSQNKLITRSGAMGEVDFSFGGNYNEKLFIGATLGFQKLKFSESSTYQEEDFTDKDTLMDVKGFTFNEFLATDGRGLNFKFGLIFRPSDFIRLGGAVHTPTYYSMKDAYNSTLSTNFDNGDKLDDASPEGTFNYSLTTPLKTIGSVAFIIKKAGIISMDYEYLDYSSATLSSSSYKFFEENNAVKSKYKSASNIKIGTEWRMDEFSFRAGYALYGNPFNSAVNNKSARSSYTGGLGFKEENYFIDLAYVYTGSEENYYLYDPSLVSAASTKFKSSSLMLTLGFRY